MRGMKEKGDIQGGKKGYGQFLSERESKEGLRERENKTDRERQKLET